ncbi:phytanoyl-CoA dioxygenase family protein [Bradyrhizobium genosp. SA-3]|uniref:phytanoyl-CoA dioxygenase family protein n=1 Tax=Bradyrhizobium genosp. SA-3 TaxID=508868 RepID=UPI0013EE5A1C|nr:phytanoyl-CoA dioxygenase family protein [Bradyrhizobium genosp. SA-3]
MVAKTAIDPEKVKADFTRDGYCIIPDVLSASEATAVRNRLMEQAAAERALGWARLQDQQPSHQEEVVAAKGASKKGVNQRVGMLIKKGKVFRELVTHPATLEFVEFALGQTFLLNSCDANIAMKGGALEGLHRDAWRCPMPYQEGDAWVKVGDRKRYSEQPDSAPSGTNVPPACVNIIWMLTDFTEENGGTRLVPDSHRRPDSPDSSVPHKVPMIAATGKAGSCLFFDGSFGMARVKILLMNRGSGC